MGNIRIIYWKILCTIAFLSILFEIHLCAAPSCHPMQNYAGDEELCCVYVPTNHLYIGDIFLVNAKDVIRPNLSVREGIGKRSFSSSNSPENICIE